MNWIHIRAEEGGMLQQLLHVRNFPTHIIVGGDGSLLSNEWDRDEPIMGQLARFVRQ